MAIRQKNTARAFFLALILLAFILTFQTSAFAGGDLRRGKELFENPAFAGSASGKSCAFCHPSGEGLERIGRKKSFTFRGKSTYTLEDVVNMAIEKILKGKPLPPGSQDMQDIVAYIRSLEKK